MSPFRDLVEVVLKGFALGLFVTIILNWIDARALTQPKRHLNRFYDLFLDPIRRYVRPMKLSPSAPVGLDLAPLILLALIWWLIYPFLMWVLG